MKKEQQEIPIRIHHFANDEPLEVLQSSLKTLSEFKLFLEVLTAIPPSQQKLIRNSRVIQAPDDTPLHQLGLQPNDRIMLLLREGRSLAEFRQQHLRRQLEQEKRRVSTESDIRRMPIHDSEGNYLQDNHFRLVRAMMTGEVLGRAVSRLFKVEHWREKEKEVLGRKGGLQSLLRMMWKEEAAQGKAMNPAASYLWNRIDGILCRMIVGFPVDFTERHTSPPASTADPRMLSQLSGMGYHQEKARQALERSCNSYNEALTILCTRKDKKRFRLGEVDCSEELFLYQWLQGKARRSVVMRVGMEGGEKELEVLLNSLRHRCPQLYEMARKKRAWIRYLAKREHSRLLSRARDRPEAESSSDESEEH